MNTLGNILWFFLGGFLIALYYALFGLLMCLTIIGIPFGVQLFKMAGVALCPFGRDVQLMTDSGCLPLVFNILWIVTGWWEIYDRLGKSHPRLVDYQITIPPGGKTDALVAATISWNNNGQLLKTRGIDSDQNEAAIKATIKMLNLIENIEINAKQQ